MDMGKRIRERRKVAGISQSELADLVGVSYITVRRWETAGRTPNAAVMPKLAEVLNTTVTYLMGETDDPKPHSLKDALQALGELVKAGNIKPSAPLTPQEEAERETKLQELISAVSQESADDAKVRLIPEGLIEVDVLSFAACMGRGRDNEDEPPEVIDKMCLPKSDVGVTFPLKPFVVNVEGNSMMPIIEDGMYAAVNPNIMPGRGEICLARFLSGGFKRDAIKFYFPQLDGGIVLKSSETSGIPPMEFTAQEVADNDVNIVGRVMSFGEKWRKL